MSRLILSDAFSHQLDQFSLPVELCDQTGQAIGHFVPSGVSWSDVLAGDGCPYSPEDLARMQRESGGRSLAEIWQSLGRS